MSRRAAGKARKRSCSWLQQGFATPPAVMHRRMGVATSLEARPKTPPPGESSRPGPLRRPSARRWALLTDRISTPEGDGTLLDHSMIVYGAGMAASNAHYSGNLPIRRASGAAGTGGASRAVRRRYGPREPVSEPSGQDGRRDRVARRLHRATDPRAAQRRVAAGRPLPPVCVARKGPTSVLAPVGP